MITQPVDKTTGLPKVEEGLFWRVRYSVGDSSYWYVELRKRTWYGSKKIDSMISSDAMTQTKIADNADTLIWWRKRKEETRRRRNDLVGDYPPKNLGG